MRACARFFASACFLAFYLILLSESSSGEVPWSLAEEGPSEEESCIQELSLDAFRAYALKNAPFVAEIDSEYAAELARAFEIETLPNPELQLEQTYTSMNLGGANDPQAQVSIGQPFRISHLGTREQISSLIKRAGDLSRKRKLLELSQKLLIQYQTVRSYHDLQSFLEEGMRRASLKVSLIQEGVEKGLFSAGDRSLFEAEQYRLQAQGEGVKLVLAKIQSELVASLGLRCAFRPPSMKVSKTDQEIPPIKVLLDKSRRSPLSTRVRMELLEELAKEEVRLADLDRVPQLTPRLVYQHTNDGGDFFGVGLTIPLPFWNRNQGERSRLAGESRVASMKQVLVSQGGYDSQIKMLRLAAVHARSQAQLYSEKIVPTFEKALRFKERVYEEGRGNILEVWQTLRALHEAKRESIEFALQAVILRAELSVLIGEELQGS